MKHKAIMICTSFLLALTFTVNNPHAASRTSEPSESLNGSRVEDSGAYRYGEMIVGELLQDITVPADVSDLLSSFYTMHRSEILRLMNGNPQMIWSTLDVVLDALPALRTLRKNDGALIVDRRVYSKAEGVLEQYRSLASEGLARDLDGLKKYVESRAIPLDGDRVKVDFK